jgi:hypothetical protein
MAILGCAGQPGAVLLVADAGGDAALLRWKDDRGGGERELARIGQDGATRWSLDVGRGPGEAGTIAAERSPWLVRGEGDRFLVAVDAEAGRVAWDRAAPPAGEPGWTTAGDAVYVWWEGGLARLARATGAEVWHVALPPLGRPTVAPALGGVVAADATSLLLFDASGRLAHRAPLFAGSWCATDRHLYWTDADRRTWRLAEGATEPRELPLEGRVRRGCGAYGGRDVVPVHGSDGVARVMAVDADGTVAWTAELGAGAHAPAEDAAEWPRTVPFLLDAEPGRRVVFVDVERGAVALAGEARAELVAATRVRVGDRLAVMAHPALLTFDETEGRVRAARLPGVEGQAPGARAGATTWWAPEASTARAVPWSQLDAVAAGDDERGEFGL